MNEGPLQIAILLYPGVTALDAVGPYEVLSRLPDVEVRFVGKETGAGGRRARRCCSASRTRSPRRRRPTWCSFRAG